MAKHKWQPGQSGNPNGRPPKQRALTEILEKAGAHTQEVDGKNVSGRRLVARMAWEGLTTGIVTFPDGKRLELSPVDWKDLLKWIYTHVDGAPAQKHEHGGDEGGPIEIIVTYAKNTPDADGPAPGTAIGKE